jgi:tRNA 2-thiouridine synthesizing protein A
MWCTIIDTLLWNWIILCDSSNTEQTIIMSSEYQITETLDVKGQSCPMPIVKTKQAIDDLAEDDVLEVVATDSGSMSDIQGWAEGTDGVALLEQVEDGDLYTHYVRKTA